MDEDPSLFLHRELDKIFETQNESMNTVFLARLLSVVHDILATQCVECLHLLHSSLTHHQNHSSGTPPQPVPLTHSRNSQQIQQPPPLQQPLQQPPPSQPQKASTAPLQTRKKQHAQPNNRLITTKPRSQSQIQPQTSKTNYFPPHEVGFSPSKTAALKTKAKQSPTTATQTPSSKLNTMTHFSHSNSQNLSSSKSTELPPKIQLTPKVGTTPQGAATPQYQRQQHHQQQQPPQQRGGQRVEDTLELGSPMLPHQQIMKGKSNLSPGGDSRGVVPRSTSLPPKPLRSSLRLGSVSILPNTGTPKTNARSPRVSFHPSSDAKVEGTGRGAKEEEKEERKGGKKAGGEQEGEGRKKEGRIKGEEERGREIKERVVEYFVRKDEENSVRKDEENSVTKEEHREEEKETPQEDPSREENIKYSSENDEMFFDQEEEELIQLSERRHQKTRRASWRVNTLFHLKSIASQHPHRIAAIERILAEIPKYLPSLPQNEERGEREEEVDDLEEYNVYDDESEEEEDEGDYDEFQSEGEYYEEEEGIDEEEDLWWEGEACEQEEEEDVQQEEERQRGAGVEYHSQLDYFLAEDLGNVLNAVRENISSSLGVDWDLNLALTLHMCVRGYVGVKVTEESMSGLLGDISHILYDEFFFDVLVQITTENDERERETIEEQIFEAENQVSEAERWIKAQKWKVSTAEKKKEECESRLNSLLFFYSTQARLSASRFSRLSNSPLRSPGSPLVAHLAHAPYSPFARRRLSHSSHSSPLTSEAPDRTPPGQLSASQSRSPPPQQQQQKIHYPPLNGEEILHGDKENAHRSFRRFSHDPQIPPFVPSSALSPEQEQQMLLEIAQAQEDAQRADEWLKAENRKLSGAQQRLSAAMERIQQLQLQACALRGHQEEKIELLMSERWFHLGQLGGAAPGGPLEVVNELANNSHSISMMDFGGIDMNEIEEPQVYVKASEKISPPTNRVLARVKSTGALVS